MQTFRSQPASSNDPQAGDGEEAQQGIKKSKYVPYIPGETNLDTPVSVNNEVPKEQSIPERQTPPSAPENLQKNTPDQFFAQQPQPQPQPQSQPQVQQPHPQQQQVPQQQAPLYYAEPQYMQYIPDEKSFKNVHAGMDRESFRKMLIGLFGVLLVVFIIPIVAFSGKSVEHKLPPDILVFQPQAQQKIVPPFTITGQAKGYWFFNDEFPVILYDSTNTAIAYGTANATDTVDNEKFIPFTATINEYTLLPAKKKGYILFQRSTGTVEQGRQNIARVPIQFGEGTGITPIDQTTTTNGVPNTTPQDPATPVDTIKQCGDGIDNDSDGSIDMQDPECHTDTNASNSASYDKSLRENKITINVPDIGGAMVNGFSGEHNGFVTLYFPNTTNDPINPSCSMIFPTRRELSSGTLGTTVEKTLRALFQGPTAEEGYSGFTTGLKRGLGLEKVQLVGDTLSIYVMNTTIVGDPSWCTVADIKKQVYQTMVQFAGINNIRIYANGQIL